MNRVLLEELHAYFATKEAPDEQEKSLLTQLAGELPFFGISSVCRDDLAHAGFDVSTVSDSDMAGIAGKLGSDYTEQLYWTSLPIIAGECFGVPKAGTPRCPACRRHTVAYDMEDGLHYCTTCDHEWADSPAQPPEAEGTDGEKNQPLKVGVTNESAGVKKTIADIKDEQDEKLSALMKSLGIFFAFDKEQLAANRQEGVSYVTTDYGMVIPKDRVKDFEEGFARIEREESEEYSRHITMDEYILYELNNREAFYTGDLQDSLEAVKIKYPDCAIGDVRRVYRSNLK